MEKYPWKRFWCTRGDIARLDHQGYLVDPELEDGKILNPTAFASEELSDLGCVALLGDPGSGKTTALEEIVQAMRNAADFRQDHFIDLNLRSYGDENRLYCSIFESDKFDRWINGTHVLTIVLDSLDECLIHNKTVTKPLQLCLLMSLRSIRQVVSGYELRAALLSGPSYCLMNCQDCGALRTIGKLLYYPYAARTSQQPCR